MYGTLLLSWPWPLCDAWGVVPVTEGRLFPASSNVPVQQGSLDPVSAPTWAAEITAHLTGATRVVFNCYGHEVSYANQCATQVTTTFLATPGQAIDATRARTPIPPFS